MYIQVGWSLIRKIFHYEETNRKILRESFEEELVHITKKPLAILEPILITIVCNCSVCIALFLCNFNSFFHLFDRNKK